MMLRRSLVGFLTLGFTLSAPSVFAQPAPQKAAEAAPASAPAQKLGLTPELQTKGEKAVSKGLRFLRGKQEANGSYGHHVGVTSMVLLAFAESHKAYRLDDGPFVSKAAEWLVAQQRADGAITGDATATYNTSLAIMALHALDKNKFKKEVEAGQKFLVKHQSVEDNGYKPEDKYYGGIGYGGDERPDLSNLQFALEALKETDFDPKSEVWKRAEVFLNRCQNRSESNDQSWAGNDGGFVYAPGDSFAGGTNSYGSMTFAGLKSLIFAQVKKDDPRVSAAFDWVKKNYDFDTHVGLGSTAYYYYLQTASKALSAYGDRYVADAKGRQRDWISDLVHKLTTLQKADGTWLNDNPKYWEDNPILATTRGILALNYALQAAKTLK